MDLLVDFSKLTSLSALDGGLGWSLRLDSVSVLPLCLVLTDCGSVLELLMNISGQEGGRNEGGKLRGKKEENLIVCGEKNDSMCQF